MIHRSDERTDELTDFKLYEWEYQKYQRYRKKIERKENEKRLGMINDRFPSTYFELLPFTGIY